MKNVILLLISIVFIVHPSKAQDGQNHFNIKGKIYGLKEGIVYLSYLSDNKQVRDSSNIKGNKFAFKGNINEPTRGFLTLKEEKYNEKHSFGFFIEPTRIEVMLPVSDFNNAKITGSRMQDESSALANSKKRLTRKYKNLLDSLKVEKDSAKSAQLNEKLLPYYLENDRKNFIYFSQNTQSYFTAYALRFYIKTLSLDSLQMFYNAMTPKIKLSSYGKILGREIDLLAGGSPGSMAKNFTKPDLNGDTLNLFDLKGKYVLLDFWASWCLPCRKGNPHLIQLYNQYKEKGIEFIGISDDDRNPDAWRKAVDKDKLPWRHVVRGLDMKKKRNEERNENDINENFGIHILPTIILIDPNGLIVGRFSDNYELLDEMLKKIFHD
jgi:thiol-disulfide isomerase/thioredoxin